MPARLRVSVTEESMNYADPRDASYIASANQLHASALASDYAALGAQLERRGIRIDDITRAVANFKVAIPSWGVGTGGTRFGRFPGLGEPRNVFEKLEDCAVIHLSLIHISEPTRLLSI